MILKSFSAKDFTELKSIAYHAVKEGIKENFSDSWRAKYVECYLPCTTVNQYKKVVAAYKSFLLGLKTEEEAKQIICSVQSKYENLRNL